MKALSIYSDKAAISLSLLCTLHCLATPILLILLPSFAVLPIEGELFHLLMIIAVIPISLYALTLGCKKHKQFSIAAIGLLGLLSLVAAVALGESLIGELGEKLLTVIGSVLICISHYKNYQQCQKKACSSC